VAASSVEMDGGKKCGRFSSFYCGCYFLLCFAPPQQPSSVVVVKSSSSAVVVNKSSKNRRRRVCRRLSSHHIYLSHHHRVFPLPASFVVRSNYKYIFMSKDSSLTVPPT
jgi:hypothetical protein